MVIISSEYKKQGFSYIAFFDLDLTLTKAISGRALAQRAFKNGLMNGSDIATALYLTIAYRLGCADPIKIMGRMLGWVKGLEEQKLTDLCCEVLGEVLVPSIYSEVNNELEMHKSQNAKTVILSSSLIQICQGMADHLKMDDIVCSKLEVRDGYMTGRPEGSLCYGHEKLVRLKEYCEKYNNKTENAWYYGDSISDLPALEVVGHPVCINPDRQLRKKATEKDWKIFLWNRYNNKSK
jgi:HAD superfamily hydrolase (TIGR01490 family)